MILVAVFIGCFLAYVGIDEVRDRINWYLLNKTDRPLEAIAQKCFIEFPAETVSQKIISLRHCVNLYSTFSADPKNRDKWNNQQGMMQWMEKYSRHETSEPPPMDCYYRAHAMVWILRALGLQAYTVVITNNADNFMDHVVVRVKNPDTGKWEIQGPLYDMAYRLKEKEGWLDSRDLLAEENFEPCDFNGKCGWGLVSREKLTVSTIKNYFSSLYDTKEKILYLSRDFDEKKVRKVQGKKMNFCEKRPEYCYKITRLGPLN